MHSSKCVWKITLQWFSAKQKFISFSESLLSPDFNLITILFSASETNNLLSIGPCFQTNTSENHVTMIPTKICFAFIVTFNSWLQYKNKPFQCSTIYKVIGPLLFFPKNLYNFYMHVEIFLCLCLQGSWGIWVNWLSFYSLTSVWIFSMLLPRHFQGFWQGEFVQQWRAFLIDDHLLYPHDLNVWFRGDVARRN